MKKFIILVIMAASASPVLCQKVTVVSATRQEWSGGMAGHYGTNYSIVIKSEKRINPDSVYINGQAFSLPHTPDGESAVRYDSLKHTYAISVGEAHQESPYPDFPPTKNNTKPTSVRHFQGAALITYKYEGKLHLLVVAQMQSLQPIAYP